LLQLAGDTDTNMPRSLAARHASHQLHGSMREHPQMLATTGGEGGDTAWGSSRPHKRTKRGKDEVDQHPSWSDELLARRL